MRELSTVFVVGTLALAAATGTLATLAMAGVFSLTTYAVMARGGRKRIELEVCDELQAQERAVALLDRFLAADPKKKGEGNPWEDPRDLALLRTTFPHAMAGHRTPDWGTLTVLRQRAQARADEFKDAVKSRVPKNDLAAAFAGVATFMWPPAGLAALGYTAYAGQAQRRGMAVRDALLKEQAEEREKQMRKAKASELLAQRRAKRAKAQRAAAAEHAAGENAASEEYEESLLAHGAAVPPAQADVPAGFQLADAMP